MITGIWVGLIGRYNRFKEEIMIGRERRFKEGIIDIDIDFLIQFLIIKFIYAH